MADSASTTSSGWFRLVSSDGYHFVVPREVATKSGMIADILKDDSDFAEVASNQVTLDSIRGAVLEKVVEYLLFKHKHEGATAKDVIPDFQERIPPEIALELLMAADYLQT